MATINWSFVYGQSLGVGASSVPQLSVDPYVSDDTFGANSSGDLIPLAMNISAQQPHRTMGERSDTTGRTQVWTNHAEGGKNYSQLKKGTAFYARAIDQATALVAANPDDQIVCRSIHWIQGFSNSSTPRAEYAGYVAELLNDYNTDIKAITGQTEDMHLFCCQLSPFNEAGHGHFYAMINNPDFVHLVCAKSWMPKIDGVHLTAEYSWALGELHGLVHKQVMIDEEIWLPLCPKSITQTDTNIVDIEMHVPEPPLVIRNDLEVAAQPASGFAILDNTSNMTNMAVSIVDGTTVRLTCTRNINGTPRVRYNNGNIMDSADLVSSYDSKPLPNRSIYYMEYAPFTFDPYAPPPPESNLYDVDGNPIVIYALQDGEPVQVNQATT